MTKILEPIQKAARNTRSPDELREALQVISQQRLARGETSIEHLVELMPDLVYRLKTIASKPKQN